MMTVVNARSAAAALCVVAALVPASATWARQTPQAELQRAIAGRYKATPVNCIQLSDIDQTRIIDRTAIIFTTRGKTLYVNTPPNGASQLDSSDTLVIETHTPQLCSVDIVKLRDMTAHMNTGFVGLGKFVPWNKDG